MFGLLSRVTGLLSRVSRVTGGDRFPKDGRDYIMNWAKPSWVEMELIYLHADDRIIPMYLIFLFRLIICLLFVDWFHLRFGVAYLKT